MSLVYHMISKDLVIKRSSDVMRKSPLKLVTILPSLVVIVTYNGFTLLRDLARSLDQSIL